MTNTSPKPIDWKEYNQQKLHPALAAAMENRMKAIDAFMDAATEREEMMRDSFDCGDDPVVAMMWTLIEELEG